MLPATMWGNGIIVCVWWGALESNKLCWRWKNYKGDCRLGWNSCLMLMLPHIKEQTLGGWVWWAQREIASFIWQSQITAGLITDRMPHADSMQVYIYWHRCMQPGNCASCAWVYVKMHRYYRYIGLAQLREYVIKVTLLSLFCNCGYH